MSDFDNLKDTRDKLVSFINQFMNEIGNTKYTLKVKDSSAYPRLFIINKEGEELEIVSDLIKYVMGESWVFGIHKAKKDMLKELFSDEEFKDSALKVIIKER